MREALEINRLKPLKETDKTFKVLNRVYPSISSSFHDSMHLGYDPVKSFSLQRFPFFVSQF